MDCKIFIGCYKSKRKDGRMNGLSEYDELLHRRQQVLKEQDLCIKDRYSAKKYFADIDLTCDERELEQLGQCICDQGTQGNKHLLSMIDEACISLREQEMEIRQLEEDMERYYQSRERNCEDELSEISRKLNLLGG